MHDSVSDLLRILDTHDAKVTFFVTGKFYYQFPGIVEMVHQKGHEIGFHSHTHRTITSAEILRQEIEYSKEFLKKYKPRGFRAPRVYLPDGLFSILKESGFAYDSSTFDAPGKAYNHDEIKIFPVSSCIFFDKPSVRAIYPKSMNLKMLSRELPFGSGIAFSYLRALYSSLLSYYGKRGKPCIFYLHLWQLYPPPGRKISLLRHHVRIVHKYPVLKRLTGMLSKHNFQTMENLLKENLLNSKPNQKNASHCLTFDLEI